MHGLFILNGHYSTGHELKLMFLFLLAHGVCNLTLITYYCFVANFGHHGEINFQIYL